MLQSWNNLGRPIRNSLPVTDLYVKFCPSSLQQLNELSDSNIFLYDFPLEYKVIEMGDYYVEPSQENAEFKCYYAVTKPQDNIAKLNPEIIAELHIPKDDLELEREALLLTGNDDDEKTVCEETDPDYPECACELLPDDEEFEDCMEALSNPDIVILTNPNRICKGSNRNQPAGRVTVENTKGLGDEFTNTDGSISRVEGVRRVKVIMKDNWFTQDVTYTDDDGCFVIEEGYKRKAWMWVKYQGERAKKIRYPYAFTWFQEDDAIIGDLSMFELESLIFPVKHYIGKLEGPIFNNIRVNFEAPTTVLHSLGFTSTTHRLWSTSTVNNGLHYFHDMAASESIAAPLSDLDIFISPNDRGGFAIMTNFIGSSNIALAMAQGAGSSTFADVSGADALDNFENVSIFDAAITAYGLSSVLNIFLPDVNIGGNFLRSDKQETITYHEIGHVSHFANVGSNYWLKLIRAEVSALGHGNSCSDDAGRIAICESWADHIGLSFSHSRYNNATIASDFPIFGNVTYEKRLERTRNAKRSHIPVGLYLDLIDPTGIEIAEDETGTTCTSGELALGTGASATILDNVSGFTNSMIFNVLDANVANPSDLNAAIITGPLPLTSNSALDVSNLFSQY